MRITLDIDANGARLGDWLRRALAGLHPSTNEACELADAVRALTVVHPAGRVSDEACATAYAEHGSIKAAARALGIARSTLRTRITRMTLAARARDAAAANDVKRTG